MRDSQPEARCTVRLKGPWTGSSAWARVLADGRVELELYDFSPQAQEHMGNDVAWTYRIETAHLPRLRELLRIRTGSDVTGDQGLLDALARSFSHVHAVRDWLKEQRIPYEELFDSWA